MGALHEGHAELVRAARREAGFVVVTIFVNPTQFGPNEDFTRYPRTEAADLALCLDAGADLAFVPDVDTMYPPGGLGTEVEPPARLTSTLEGAIRPGHFRGVATVVAKLLNLAQPDLAWFGEKDYQQLLVIRALVGDLDMPVVIRPVPTVREPDGLAMSSRNRYLNEAERRAAVVLSAALRAAQQSAAGGVRDAGRIRQILRETVEFESLARLDYAEVADARTLERLEELQPGVAARALLAARVGPARLIDNAPLIAG